MKTTTDDIVKKILECEKEMKISKDSDLSKFSKKYLDYLELKEMYYNISEYES